MASPIPRAPPVTTATGLAGSIDSMRPESVGEELNASWNSASGSKTRARRGGVHRSAVNPAGLGATTLPGCPDSSIQLRSTGPHGCHRRNCAERPGAASPNTPRREGVLGIAGSPVQPISLRQSPPEVAASNSKALSEATLSGPIRAGVPGTGPRERGAEVTLKVASDSA